MLATLDLTIPTPDHEACQQLVGERLVGPTALMAWPKPRVPRGKSLPQCPTAGSRTSDRAVVSLGRPYCKRHGSNHLLRTMIGVCDSF